MINFRFHLVAVTAVIVAVVVGLVFGTLALRGPVPAPVSASTVAADQRGSDLQEQVDALAERLSAGERMATDLAPSLLAGRLTGRQVTVVLTASAEHDMAGVEAMLAAGGAAVTGRIELTDRFTDPARRGDLLDLATASLPPGVTTGQPATADGVLATTALFAAVLLRRTPPVPEGDRRSVLAAYVSRGYLTGSSGAANPADAIVFLTGTAAAEHPDSPVSVLATGLGRAGAVVAAGTGAAAGSVLGQLRSDPLTTNLVSTVDNVNTPLGKLATAWALADLLAGRCGHYGDGPGATSSLPPVAPPTIPPSPSPSAVA